jgi:hypothetical protein
MLRIISYTSKASIGSRSFSPLFLSRSALSASKSSGWKTVGLALSIQSHTTQKQKIHHEVASRNLKDSKRKTQLISTIKVTRMRAYLRTNEKERQSIISWLYVRDLLCGLPPIVEQDVQKAMEVVRTCEHENARWLEGLFRGRVVHTPEDARSVFLEHAADPKAQCLAEVILDESQWDMEKVSFRFLLFFFFFFFFFLSLFLCVSSFLFFLL